MKIKNERSYKLKKNLVIPFLFQIGFLFAQTDTLKKINFTAFGEMYYSYDFSNPQTHQKENFIYNHKKHNEVNANLVVVKASYLNNNTRANLGLMAGNYAQYNLSLEPTWAQFVYEANIGVKVSKKPNLWLDAGIMPSHIGFESAISADCWTLTRSILAENSPYYETGLKLSFTNKKENLNLAFLVLNGWQKIEKPSSIQKPSFGLQVNYKPTKILTLNYSNFLGTDKPDSLNSFRTFHNFYAMVEPLKKIGIILGFDIGTDKYNTKSYGIWYSPVVIIRYTLTEKLKIAVRGEYYYDKNQIIITTNSANGFQVAGISTNVDLKINNAVQFRIEGKLFNAKDEIFDNKHSQNYSLTSNISIKL